MSATVTIVVKKGETIWDVVERGGFPGREWKTICAAPYNAPFMKKNPNPGINVRPGSKLLVPRFTKRMIDEAVKKVLRLSGRLWTLQKSITQMRKTIDSFTENPPAREAARRVRYLREMARFYRDEAESMLGGCAMSRDAICPEYGAIDRATAKSMKFEKEAKALERFVRSMKNVTEAAIRELKKRIAGLDLQRRAVEAQLKKHTALLKQARKHAL